MARTDRGMPGWAIQNGSIAPCKRSDYWKYGRYVFEKFSGQPFVYNAAAGGAFATASATQVDALITPGGNFIEVYQTTAQTLMPLAHATLGLEIALDQVLNETVEYVPGGNRATSPFAFVVGTDPSFFFRCKFNVTDASGMDQFIMGFRKQESYAVPTALLSAGDPIYTDLYGVGFCATPAATANAVAALSDLNNGGSATRTALNFTFADGLAHQFEVRVVGRKATAYINGVEAGGRVIYDGDGNAITAQATKAGHAFTFDSGDTVIPFIVCRQAVHLTPAYWKEMTIGHLISEEADPNARGES